MSEALAELQHRDEINRQLKAKTEEDERLHAEQTNSILNQNQQNKRRASDLNWYKKQNSRELLLNGQELKRTRHWQRWQFTERHFTI